MFVLFPFIITARKFFPVTFVGSILWIAAFSYLMVWWATVTGETFGIPPEVRCHVYIMSCFNINVYNVVPGFTTSIQIFDIFFRLWD